MGRTVATRSREGTIVYLENVPDHISDEAAARMLGHLPHKGGAELPEPQSRSLLGVPKEVGEILEPTRAGALGRVAGVSPVETGELATEADPSAERPLDVSVLAPLLGDVGAARFGLARREAVREPIEQAKFLKDTLGLTEPKDLFAIRDPQDPSNVTFLIRDSETGKYVELDSPFVTSLADVAEGIAPVTSLANLFSVGGFAGVSLLAGPAAGPAARLVSSLVGRALTSGLGAGAGFMTESEVERRMGREEATRGQALTEAEEIMFLTTMFELGGEALRGIGTRATGRAPGISPRVAEVSRQLRREMQFEGLTLADLMPAARRVSAQAFATFLPARGFHLGRLNTALESIERTARELDPEGLTLEPLENTIRSMERRLEAVAGEPIPTTFEAVSRLAAKGLRDANRFMIEREKRLLRRANNAVRQGGLAADLGPLQSRVANLRLGVLGRAREEGALTPTFELPRLGRVQRLDGPNPALKRLMDQFLSFPEELRGLQFRGQRQTVLDQLDTIRRRAFALTDSGDPYQDDLAQEFVDILDESIDSFRITAPSARGTEAKRAEQALTRYRAAVRQREKIGKDLRLRQLIKDLERDPEKMGHQLITPNEPDRVRKMRRLLRASGQGQKFELARLGYIKRIMANPENLEREISKWSPETRRLIMDEEQAKVLINYSRAFKRLRKGPLAKMIQDQSIQGERLLNAVLTEDVGTVRALIQESGGRDSPLGRMLRRSLFQGLVDASETRQFGVRIVKPETMTRLTNQLLRKRDVLELILNKQEISNLEAMADYFSTIPDVKNMADALQAAQLAGPTFFLDPRALIARTRNAIVHMVGNSKASTRLIEMSGPDGKIRDIGFIRPLAITVANSTDEWQRDAVAIYGEDAEPDPEPPRLEELFPIVSPGAVSPAMPDISDIVGPSQ